MRRTFRKPRQDGSWFRAEMDCSQCSSTIQLQRKMNNKYDSSCEITRILQTHSSDHAGNRNRVATSVRPAQAGYTVTLQQVGPNVVATGSGAINLTGLTFSQSTSLSPEIQSSNWLGPRCKLQHIHGADFFQRRLLRRGAQWTDEFREPAHRVCQQWQRRHGRDSRVIDD